MKHSKRLLVACLVIMMMAVGCKRMDDRVDVAGTAASPLILPIYAGETAPPSVLVGHVSVWDDVNNLYVKYDMDVTQPDGSEFTLRACDFDVRIDSASFPWTAGLEPAVMPEEFLYRSIVEDPYKEHTDTISNYGGWLTGSTVAAAAHCVLYQHRANGDWVLQGGWAKDPNHPFKYGCQGWWFPYTLEVPHDGEWHEFTAWGGKAYPKWKDWEFPGKNWALYINYNLNASQYVGTMYAGNPKVNPKMPGTVTITDDVVDGVGSIYVTYTITNSAWAIFAGHAIVRGTLADIPQVKGNPIPGQFDKENFFGPFNPPENEVKVTIPYDPAWGTNLFIGAHAEVGWYY